MTLKSLKYVCRKDNVKKKWNRMDVIYHVVQSLNHVCLPFCDPMDCSTPSFHVLHYLLKFVQTHIRWVCDAIQPSHPLLSPSLAFNLSQHQGISCAVLHCSVLSTLCGLMDCSLPGSSVQGDSPVNVQWICTSQGSSYDITVLGVWAHFHDDRKDISYLYITLTPYICQKVKNALFILYITENS